MKFHDLKLRELKEIAKSLKIKGTSSKKRLELADHLSKTHKLTREGVKERKTVKKKNYYAEGKGILDEIEKINKRLSEINGIVGGQLPRDVTDKIKDLDIA